ncbi:ceramide kinase-like protein [Biomphalaria glabrata]|uniref:Ceramide kinase-like protein n=1 Tax=Biomphalaria glabrata TaxID=6526 RepID=A0A9W3AJJ9_BIOGL|nr:ceramide kinase-like protein [Biomphalaria glabrata]
MLKNNMVVSKAFHLNWKDIMSVKPAPNLKEAGVLLLHYISHATNKILLVKTLQIQGIRNCDQWIDLINHHISVSGRPKRLFVVINPIGGAGKGLHVYYDTVEPLFKLASIETSVIVTERSKHALNIAESTDFSHFDGIVIVGGDGLYQEILQGLTVQVQKKDGVNYNHCDQELHKLNVPLGIIPAGTGNGVTRMINGVIDVRTAALNIIRGEHHRAQVFTVYNNNKLLCVCGLIFAYGMFSDLIKRTDELRWMKRLRYPFAIIGTLMKRKRMFQAELHYRLSVLDSMNEGSSLAVCMTWQQAIGLNCPKVSDVAEWMTIEPAIQDYCCIYALPFELIPKDNHNIVNPYGQHVQLIVCTGCSKLAVFKSFFDFLMGKTITSKPGSLEVIKNIRDFKLKAVYGIQDRSSSQDVRNTALDHLIDVDGEVLNLETDEIIVRLQNSFVPLFGCRLLEGHQQ